jgi:hypothetical protein
MTEVADLASGAPGAAETASAGGEASLEALADAPPVGAGPLAPLFEASELLSILSSASVLVRLSQLSLAQARRKAVKQTNWVYYLLQVPLLASCGLFCDASSLPSRFPSSFSPPFASLNMLIISLGLLLAHAPSTYKKKVSIASPNNNMYPHTNACVAQRASKQSQIKA